MKNRIMVVYSGWLGDLVWIIPTIHALKAAFDSVSLVVSEVQAPLAEIMKNGLVDAVFVDSPKQRMATARGVRDAARAKGIQTFLDLKGRGKNGIYMPWGRDVRILMPHRRDAREFFLARLLHPFASSLPARPDGHMVEAYLSGLTALGMKAPKVCFDLPYDAKTIREGESIVKREGLRSGRCVALNIGSAQFSKIWPAQNYRRLAQILTSDLACKVVIMGAKQFGPNGNYDLKISQEVFGKGPFTNLIEVTSLAVDAYLLSSGAFAVSVGNDSFANHIAGSASETNEPGAVQASNGRMYKANHTVSLFAPTNPAYCRPYDPTGAFNKVVMPAGFPAACVYDHVAHTCPHYGDRYCVDKAHCMEHLTVDQVVAAVEEKLQAPVERKGRRGAGR
ncbi:MAG TPA: hypothetical protein DCS43_04475 [Verrucomicrobia bacterium]|nr:hypothetical protein [Verrucomicrobiota bacterium]